MTISTTRALAAAAALTIIALGAVAPSYAGQRSGDLTGAPTVGTCSTMTYQQMVAVADRSTPVDCSLTHTAEVAGVVKLPTKMKWDTATKTQLHRVVVGRCLPKLQAMLGRTDPVRDSSDYSMAWFEPTKGQRAAGARWLSCSIVLFKAASLAPLPTSTVPFLPSGTLPDTVARCLTAKGFNTYCGASHAWRATGTFAMAGTYPGRKAIDKKATAKCATRTTTTTYAWTHQDKVTWNVAGDHVVVCYSHTSS